MFNFQNYPILIENTNSPSEQIEIANQSGHSYILFSFIFLFFIICLGSKKTDKIERQYCFIKRSIILHFTEKMGKSASSLIEVKGMNFPLTWKQYWVPEGYKQQS